MTDPVPDPDLHGPDCPPDCTTTRRHAAGEDPRKRDQILAGAWSEFMTHGFDAATTRGICRAAGVSKSTLYVYFRDKEDLFVALVEQRRALIFDRLSAALEGPGSIASRLNAYARAFAGLLTTDETLRAQRIVVAVADRMPDLARRFHEAGARQILQVLGRWLCEADAAGTLVVPDPDLAAQQFTELALAGVWRQRLFGVRRAPPSDEEITRLADGAVRVFMAAHLPPQAGGPQTRP